MGSASCAAGAAAEAELRVDVGRGGCLSWFEDHVCILPPLVNAHPHRADQDHQSQPPKDESNDKPQCAAGDATSSCGGVCCAEGGWGSDGGGGGTSWCNWGLRRRWIGRSLEDRSRDGIQELLCGKPAA